MTRSHLIDTKLCKVDVIPVLEMKIQKLMRLTENKFLIQGQSLNHQKGWNWLGVKLHRRSYGLTAFQLPRDHTPTSTFYG